MATTLRQTQIFAGNTILPTTGTLLLGATAAPILEYFLNGSGFRLNSGMAFTNYGGRITFGSAQDMSTRKYVQFSIMSQMFGWPAAVANVASGGLRIFFIDGGGNYVGFNLYGKDVKNFDPNYGSGFPVQYMPPDDAVNGAEWLIARDRTPDYSSGTLNWGAVTAVELQINHTQAGYFGATDVSVYLIWLGTFDPNLITGTGNTFATIENAVQTSAGWRWKRNFQRTNFQWFSLPAIPYTSKAEIEIGDGATPTALTDSFVSFPLWNRYEDDVGSSQSLGPCVQVLNNDRPIVINQTATCNTTLSDTSWSSSSGWSLTIQGSASGTALFTRNQFWRAEYITMAHGQFIDCIFDSCKTLNLTASTIFTGAEIRNANGVGLKLTAAPGDYSAKTFSLAGNTGYDVVIDPSSAGTFTLTGMSADPAYTVKIRNASATHAITVEIPAGITYSTSTAGGAITITNPAVIGTALVTGFTAGSRLYVRNVTTATTIVNAIQAGTSWTLSYTDGVEFSSGDTVLIRIAYQSGLVANLEEQYTAVPSSAGFTQVANPTLNQSYDTYGVDGSTCTEFTWDGANLQVDINDGDNATVIQRIGAWYSYYITTSTGIVSVFGGIDWESINSIQIISAVVPLQLDNVKATPLQITGGRMYRDDGANIIASASGSIHFDYAPVYPADQFVWEQVLEGNLSAADIMRINLSVLAGLTDITPNGADVATVKFKSVDGLTDRVIAEMESSERKIITLDGN